MLCADLFFVPEGFFGCFHLCLLSAPVLCRFDTLFCFLIPFLFRLVTRAHRTVTFFDRLVTLLGCDHIFLDVLRLVTNFGMQIHVLADYVRKDLVNG